MGQLYYLVFILVLTGGMSYHANQPLPPEPAPIEANQASPTYENNLLGFSVDLPKTWYKPELNSNDPHFYENKACADSEITNCQAFEVMELNPETTIESAVKSAQEQNLGPQKDTTLIADAIVVKSKSEPPAEGWKLQYSVFFTKENRQYLIFSNNEKVEKILKTFKLK